MNLLPFARQIEVVSLLTEGNSLRAIARLTGVDRNTVARLNRRVGDACRRLHDARMRNLQCALLELDETWSFIGKRQKNLQDGDSAELGDIYLWLGLDVHTRLIVSYLVGKRTAESARAFLAESDVMLAVGTRFTEEESDRWGLRLPESLIHVEIDPDVIDRNSPATVGVLGDARAALQLISAQLQDAKREDGGSAARVSHLRQNVWGYCQTRAPEGVELVQTLRKALPRETIIVSDLTVAAYWCRRLLDVYEPRTNIYPWGFCTLGFGLPAAIGAKMARPERPVVVLCGDGGFLFNCQELAAAVQLGLPIVTLVFNDSAYGVLRPQQEVRYGAAHEVDLVNPDFMKLAEAFGVDGCRVESIEQLGPAVTKAIKADRSALIELPGTLPWPIMEPSARMFEAEQ